MCAKGTFTLGLSGAGEEEEIVMRCSICMLATCASASELSALQGEGSRDRYTFHEKQNGSWTQHSSQLDIYVINNMATYRHLSFELK